MGQFEIDSLLPGPFCASIDASASRCEPSRDSHTVYVLARHQRGALRGVPTTWPSLVYRISSGVRHSAFYESPEPKAPADLRILPGWLSVRVSGAVPTF